MDTVQELNENVDKIISFLSGIIQTAEQTNMLALNASIETARAENASSVNQINQIIYQIKDRTKNALDEISRIENIADLFSHIDEEAESIAKISEGHASSTEELLATLEKYNTRTVDMNNLMRNIKDSSENLQAIIR